MAGAERVERLRHREQLAHRAGEEQGVRAQAGHQAARLDVHDPDPPRRAGVLGGVDDLEHLAGAPGARAPPGRRPWRPRRGEGERDEDRHGESRGLHGRLPGGRAGRRGPSPGGRGAVNGPARLMTSGAVSEHVFDDRRRQRPPPRPAGRPAARAPAARRAGRPRARPRAPRRWSGLCTPAAEAAGVRPGLRVGEALARCPDLDLVVADPDAAADAVRAHPGAPRGVRVRRGADGARRGGVRRARHPAPARRARRGAAPRARGPAGGRGRPGGRGARRSSPPSRRRARPRPAGRSCSRRGRGGRVPRARCPPTACPSPPKLVARPPRPRPAHHRPGGRRCRGRRPSTAWASPAWRPGAWPAARPTGRRARASPRARCGPRSPSPSRSGPCPRSTPPRGCCWASSRRRRAAAAPPCAPSPCAPASPTGDRGCATWPCARRRPTPSGSPSPPSRASREITGAGHRAVDRRRRLRRPRRPSADGHPLARPGAPRAGRRGRAPGARRPGPRGDAAGRSRSSPGRASPSGAGR